MWLNTTEPEQTTAITWEDNIKKFRVGPYADATVDTKKKWCHVMLHFLPSVCSKYGKSDIRQALPASAVSSPSDEALVMWLLRFNAEVWGKENDKKNKKDEKDSDRQNDSLEEEEEEEDEATTAGTKKRKRKGPHMSQVNLQVFLDMLNETTAKRVEADGGKGWDDALMLAAKEEAKSGNGAKADSFEDAIVGTGKATEKPRVCMPYILTVPVSMEV